MDLEKIKRNILEICSEDAYGSWELWDNDSPRDQQHIEIIIHAVQEMIENGLIVSEEYLSSNNTYKAVPFTTERLEKELKLAIKGEVDSDTFYWFYATDKGQELDNNRFKSLNI